MSEATTLSTEAPAEGAKPGPVEALFPEGKPAEAIPPADAAASATTEAKPAEAKPTESPPAVEGKETALGKEPPPGSVKPEDYKFEFPAEVQVDEEQLGATKTLLSSLNEGKGISPKDAQAIVNAHLEAVAKADTAYLKAFNDQQELWKQELKADKDLGGEKLDKEVIPNINTALSKVLSAPEIKEVKRWLDSTGMGNHPTLVKLLNGLAQPFVEGKGVPPGQPVGNKGLTAAEKLFPSQPAQGA